MAFWLSEVVAECLGFKYYDVCVTPVFCSGPVFRLILMQGEAALSYIYILFSHPAKTSAH